MKNKYFVLTLDLESEVSGVLDNKYEILKGKKSIELLLSLLKDNNIKLSVFVVGEIIDDFPDIISLFMKYDCEFHCHSHSHSSKNPDSEEEILKSRNTYEKFFRKPPIGYRAPQGKISPKGIKTLEKFGFKFDSSIFPSYYPNTFKYLLSKRYIYKHKNSSIVEIPFSSVTPFRLTLSISYIKLLGNKIYRILLNIFGIPNILIFGSHLHDFFIDEDTIKRLPFLWKIIYKRNKNKGMDFLKQYILFFKEKGYKSVFISEIYNLYKNKT